MIERVYQVFCILNHLNLAFLGICINPKACPPLTFHQPKFLGGTQLWLFINPRFFLGYPPLTFHQPKFLGGTHPWLFINPKVFGGYPPLTFHQPKGFFGVPTSDFSSTKRFFGGYPPLTFHQPKCFLGVPTSDFSKKCQIQMVKNAKNMVHSFYHILYQPKGVPTSIDNFSGSGGKYLLMTFWMIAFTVTIFPHIHCKFLNTNFRLIIIFSCYYYTWKCVKGLKVVDFKHYGQISVFSAANSKLHSNYWFFDVKWKCISIYSETKYMNW